MQTTPTHQRTEHGLGLASVSNHELAASAVAMKSRAMVEAKFVIALQRPRNLLQVRDDILQACRTPGFAQIARYSKPVGGNRIVGPSIRFAEQAIRAMRNIDVSTTTLFEDDQKRILHVSVTDLETNTSYGEDITIAKTVERKKATSDRTVLGQRINSYGDTVFIVEATEDELINKVNAAKSKVIRNSGLRIIPQDIIDEAMSIVVVTLSKGGSDPKAETKRICDAFAGIGINPEQLETYLGHPLTSIVPAELADLRTIYTAIADGEAKWSDYVQPKLRNTGEEPKEPKPITQPQNPSSEPPNAASEPQQPASKPTTPTSRQQLEQIVTEAGYTFTDLQRWGLESGNIPDADSISGFSEIHEVVARRLVRAKGGMLSQLASMKGAAQ